MSYKFREMLFLYSSQWAELISLTKFSKKNGKCEKIAFHATTNKISRGVPKRPPQIFSSWLYMYPTFEVGEHTGVRTCWGHIPNRNSNLIHDRNCIDRMRSFSFMKWYFSNNFLFSYPLSVQIFYIFKFSFFVSPYICLCLYIYAYLFYIILFSTTLGTLFLKIGEG